MNPPMRFWSCLSTTGLIQCHPHSNTLHYVLKHRIHFMRRGSTFRINPKYRTPQYEPTHQEDVTGPQLSIARRVQSSPVADARFPFNDELEQRALRRELQDLVEKPEGSYDRKWTLAPTGRNIEKLFIFEHSQQSLEFIVQTFQEAERRSHKSHLSNVGLKVTVRWLTSSDTFAGIHGLTWKDIKMAQFCDRIADSIKSKDFQENDMSGMGMQDNIIQKQSKDPAADTGSSFETKRKIAGDVVRRIVRRSELSIETEDKIAADKMGKMVDKQAKEKELMLKSIEDRKRVAQEETDVEAFRLEMGLGLKATEATKETTDRRQKDAERIEVLAASLKLDSNSERMAMKEMVNTQHVARWMKKQEETDPTWKSEKIKQLEVTSDPETKTTRERPYEIESPESSDKHYHSKVRHAEEKLQLRFKKLLALKVFAKKSTKEAVGKGRPLKRRSRRQAFNSRRQMELNRWSEKTL